MSICGRSFATLMLPSRIVPRMVRLKGANVVRGKDIIRNSGLNVLAGDNLADAAQMTVKAVKSAERINR